MSFNERKLLTKKAVAYMVSQFNTAAKATSWEVEQNFDQHESLAVSLFVDLSGFLLPSEFQELRDGWSQFRITGNDEALNRASDRVVQRIQP